MRCILVLAGLCLCAMANAATRTLELTNGDRLTGLVLERTADEIVLRHALLGDVRVPASQVVNESEEPQTSEEQGLTAPSQVEGTELAERQKREQGAEADSPAAADVTTPAEPPTPPGLFGSGLLIGWQHRAAAGVAGSAGNSDVLHFNAGLSSKFKSESTRRVFNSGAFVSQTDGEASKNQAFTEYTNDWLAPGSPWFYFAQGRYDYDQFEDWRHRVGAQVGPGYEFFKEPSFDLRGRVGAGFTRTFGDEDEFTPELTLGLEGEWRVASNQKLFGSVSFIPNLAEQGEYRTLSSAGWIIDLTPGGKLHLELGVENEYDSDPEGDARNNDLDYYSRMGYEF